MCGAAWVSLKAQGTECHLLSILSPVGKTNLASPGLGGTWGAFRKRFVSDTEANACPSMEKRRGRSARGRRGRGLG